MRLQGGRSGFDIPVGARGLSVLQNVQTGCEAHRDSSSIGTVVFLGGVLLLLLILPPSPPPMMMMMMMI